VGGSEDALRAALVRSSVGVWAPYALISERTDIEESWRLTSDSLALWLAARIGAARCYLIKSIARQQRRMGAEQLAREGLTPGEGPAPNALRALFLVGPHTQNKFHPESKHASDEFISQVLPRKTPDRIRFVTWTPRYNRCFWVAVEGLERQYESTIHGREGVGLNELEAS